MKQNEISFEGCAMEARIYAEDPARDFMPSAGRLVKYNPPKQTSKSQRSSEMILVFLKEALFLYIMIQ